MNTADNIFGPDAVPRGAAGLGISEAYPVAVYGRGDNQEAELATADELEAAGFPGRPHELLGKSIVYSVLKDEGEIVATWDEGRWWTAQESEAFVALLLDRDLHGFAATVNELAGLPNRAARRKKR
jgi:hypothetical protein